jgi:hypothetical protein
MANDSTGCVAKEVFAELMAQSTVSAESKRLSLFIV